MREAQARHDAAAAFLELIEEAIEKAGPTNAVLINEALRKRGVPEEAFKRQRRKYSSLVYDQYTDHLPKDLWMYGYFWRHKDQEPLSVEAASAEIERISDVAQEDWFWGTSASTDSGPSSQASS